MQISLWHQCLRRLEAELPEQAFNTWIRPLQAVEDGDRLRLLAPNRYVVDWVNQNCTARISELVDELVPVPGPTSDRGNRVTAPAAPHSDPDDGWNRPAGATAARGTAREPARAAARRRPPPHHRSAAPVRRPAERRVHVREFRRGQEQPAGARRRGPGRARTRGGPTTRCSSTAASAWARPT